MPDHRKLKIGDRIRLLCVPAGDMEQRERELRKGTEDAGWTADTIERIIARDPVVVITTIDEHGLPWFDYELKAPNGGVEHHSLAIMEDESWCTLGSAMTEPPPELDYARPGSRQLSTATRYLLVIVACFGTAWLASLLIGFAWYDPFDDDLVPWLAAVVTVFGTPCGAILSVIAVVILKLRPRHGGGN